MGTAMLPRTGGPDHPVAPGGQPSGMPNVLTCGIRSYGQLVFVILGGELDIATAPGLARRLAPLAEAGSHLLLDLAGLGFCDCAGLSQFLRLRRQVIAAGGSLHLTAPIAAVRRLIVAARLDGLLLIAAGPAEVITELGCDAVTGPTLQPADDIDIGHMQDGAVRAVSAAS